MQCILITDSIILAEKYRTSQQYVIELIQKNIQIFNETCEVLFLDAADYFDELCIDNTPSSYHSIIIDFVKGMGLSFSPSLSVFILGGDDVIPMYRFDNPVQEGVVITTDYFYSFSSFEDCIDADLALFNVGRLPMENGIMPTSIKDDLQSYFNLVAMFFSIGIDVDRVVMTSAESFLPASIEMVDGLPVETPVHIPNATRDNLYVSPNLTIEDEFIAAQYTKGLENADMLLFNLHGSDVPRYSSFYGEGVSGHNTPEAYSIGLLKSCNTRIFNTVACFGGRFIGYNRTSSMVLSALYGNGVLLFAGSSVCALGRHGQIFDEVQGKYVSSGMSEIFMKLYSQYLLRGLSAGEAFLRAKCDYYNSSVHLDGLECALATILMFNLFGMPALQVNPKGDVAIDDYLEKNVHNTFSAKDLASYANVYQKNESGSSSILEKVRSSVDHNLLEIRKRVQSKLYDTWGLHPDNLSRVEEISKNGAQCGFRFEYSSKSNLIDKRIFAYTDCSGNIKDLIHLK